MSAPAGWRLPAELALAAAAGALYSLPFVFTWAWPLQLLLLAGLAARVARVSPRRAAAIGAVFGTAWLAAGTWWLYISMHRYGGLPAPFAVLAVLALAAALSLYLAVALAAAARWRSGRPWPDALRFAAAWLLAELARGVLFTGFPWVATGYAQVDAPLAALAPWIGVYGIGAAAAFIAAWFASGLNAFRAARGTRLRQAVPALAAFALIGLLAALPVADFSRPNATLQVSLIQTNVPQDEKFAAEHLPDTLAWLGRQLQTAPGQLVMAPETAVPLLPEQLDPAYWDALTGHFHTGDQAALIGLPLGSFERGYTNSVAGIARDTAALTDGFYRYDKHHLVPFGEFIPTGFRWFTELMNIPLGDFNRGPLVAPPFIVRGERVAPNICYEDLFGEELGARFADAEQAPTIFANLSNIGWFGDTIAIAQHLQISRLRTLEFQRPMLRATNTGATVIIDHRGRVTQPLAPFTRGVLQGEVEGRTGLTPYARWVSRFGLWPALVFALLAWGLAGRAGRHP